MSNSERNDGWRFVLPLAAGLALGIGMIALFRLVARPLALFVVGITVADAMVPVVEWLERRTHHRSLAIAIPYLGLILVMIGIGLIVVPPLTHEARVFIDAAPEMLARLEKTMSAWNVSGLNAAQFLSYPPRILGFAAVRFPLSAARALLDVLVVLFLSVYWLVSSPAIRSFTLSLVPERHSELAGSVLNEMGRAMGGYVRGAIVNACIMGVLAWVGLMLIGMPFPVVLGVLTMLGEIVPVLGPVLVGCIVALIGLEVSLTKALLAVSLFTALVQIEGHLLTPNVMKRQTKMPQTLVLFAIVAGAALGGVLGIIVAIPLVAALRVFVLRVLAPMERKAVGNV